MSKFLSDKKQGDKAENLLVEKLKSVGQVYKSFGKTEYDILLKNRRFHKIEVKYDLYSKKSGNIAVEYFNPRSNKPSGIASSEADLWVYIVPENYNKVSLHIITLSKLLQFIKTNKPYRVISVGGDKNASLVLYKKQDILPVFEEITGATTEELTRYFANI